MKCNDNLIDLYLSLLSEVLIQPAKSYKNKLTELFSAYTLTLEMPDFIKSLQLKALFQLTKKMAQDETAKTAIYDIVEQHFATEENSFSFHNLFPPLEDDNLQDVINRALQQQANNSSISDTDSTNTVKLNIQAIESKLQTEKKQKAAITIQAYSRGHIARQNSAKNLYEKFIKQAKKYFTTFNETEPFTLVGEFPDHDIQINLGKIVTHLNKIEGYSSLNTHQIQAARIEILNFVTNATIKSALDIRAMFSDNIFYPGKESTSSTNTDYLESVLGVYSTYSAYVNKAISPSGDTTEITTEPTTTFIPQPLQEAYKTELNTMIQTAIRTAWNNIIKSVIDDPRLALLWLTTQPKETHKIYGSTNTLDELYEQLNTTLTFLQNLHCENDTTNLNEHTLEAYLCLLANWHLLITEAEYTHTNDLREALVTRNEGSYRKVLNFISLYPTSTCEQHKLEEDMCLTPPNEDTQTLDDLLSAFTDSINAFDTQEVKTVPNEHVVMDINAFLPPKKPTKKCAYNETLHQAIQTQQQPNTLEEKDHKNIRQHRDRYIKQAISDSAQDTKKFTPLSLKKQVKILSSMTSLYKDVKPKEENLNTTTEGTKLET